jgi:hypothetical protein
VFTCRVLAEARGGLPRAVTQPVDVFVSHDWPRGIYRHGNAQKLVQNKRFFEKEVKENRCSPILMP